METKIKKKKKNFEVTAHLSSPQSTNRVTLHFFSINALANCKNGQSFSACGQKSQ